jgi:hypothetical protein
VGTLGKINRSDRHQGSRPSLRMGFVGIMAYLKKRRRLSLIAPLTFGFARIGPAPQMRVEDLQSKGSGFADMLTRPNHAVIPFWYSLL